MKRLALPLALLAITAACSTEEESVDGVTPSEQKALDEAAEMIEERRLPPEAISSEAVDTPKAEGEKQP